MRFVYPYFCQADTRWANTKLRNKTIKNSGCLITSVAAKITGEGKEFITPNEVDSYMDKCNGYVKGGDAAFMDVLYKCYTDFLGITPPKQGVIRTPVSNFPAVGEEFACIGKVLTKRNTTHFILLLEDGSIMDPGRFYRGKPQTWQEVGYKPLEIIKFPWG